MTARVAGPPPIESLIPHRDPALLARVIADLSPEEITCIAVIPGDHPLVEQGAAPCLLGIEAAAQAAAALEAVSRPALTIDPGIGPQIGPSIGYLVGVREATFHLAELPAGWPLRVIVRPIGSAPPLAVYEAKVEIDGEVALTATFSTYLKRDDP